MNIPKIKICCISSIKEAKLAIQYGASAIGLVGPMPSGPGVISNNKIHEISASTTQLIDTFLLTSETDVKSIIQHYLKTKTTTIQFVDKLKEGSIDQIRSMLPGIKLVQVIHVIDESSISEAIKSSKMVDAILLDSGNPHKKIKELGGTGRTHNWQLSKEIVDSIDTPVYLAGGINPSNIKEAIEVVNPYGIDLCSGVRTAGKLDELKLKNLFNALATIHS